jgi:prepilin-type N-terminal cleavage/methylation domain-containing protein
MASAARRLGRLERWTGSAHGLTLIELLVVLAVIATLSTIALLLYSNFTEQARVARAIADIANISSESSTFQMMNERLPHDLAEINRATFKDPWGNRMSIWTSSSAADSLARTTRCIRSTRTLTSTAKGRTGTARRRSRRPGARTTSFGPRRPVYRPCPKLLGNMPNVLRVLLKRLEKASSCLAGASASRCRLGSDRKGSVRVPS